MATRSTNRDHQFDDVRRLLDERTDRPLPLLPSVEGPALRIGVDLAVSVHLGRPLRHYGQVTALDVDTLELIHSELKSRLDLQRDVRSRIDVKLSALLTLALASVPLGLWDRWSWYIAPARFMLLLTAVISLRGLAIRSVWVAPIPRALAEKYMESSKTELLEVLIGTLVQTFESNVPISRDKARRWRVGVAFLSIAVVLAIVGRWLEQGVLG